MPWHIVSDHPDCSGYAVVKDEDGSVAGCHPTEDEAHQHMAALYANEPGRSEEADDDGVMTGPPRDGLIRGLPVAPEFRATDEVGDGRLGTLDGTLAEYGQWAEVRSLVEGNFMERIMPGAFAKTFAENRSRIRVIYDHGQDKFIGRKPLGPLEDVSDDGQRVRYQAALIDTDYNRSLVPGLRAGLYGSSWRMDVLKKRDVYRPQRSEYNPEGIPERTVLEVRVAELGPTPFPIYAGTSAGLRSLTDEYLADRLRDATALPAGPEPQAQSDAASRTAAYPAITPADFVRLLGKE